MERFLKAPCSGRELFSPKDVAVKRREGLSKESLQLT